MSPNDTAHVIEAAKARAIELRREAIHEFWNAAFAAMRRLGFKGA